MTHWRRAIAAAVLILAIGLTAASQSAQQPGQAKTPPAQPAQNPPAKTEENAPQQQKPPAVGQLKREVRLVNIVFSVLDKHNHFVTDLEKNNFEVFDDDIPQQVEFFSRETNLPLRIGLLLDTSNSIHSRLEFEQQAAFDFLYHIVRPGKDMAFLMTFDTHPQVQQTFTSNLDLMRQAIFSQRAGGGTALYDAIYQASNRYLRNPPPPTTGTNIRRVLVVISDGLDDLSDHARSSAIEMAERSGVVIYTISTTNKWVSPDQQTSEDMPYLIHYTPGDKVLKQFADDTGGRSFNPYRVEDLAQAFVDIDTELRSQYSIAYTPSTHAEDGKFHPIHIEILHRHGLKVRARQGYFAERPVLAPAPTANPGR
ncbi:MAG: VWA domain-containing protein [Acidobacteriota bacterium]|nr:VWA domain-containing protein [Acidobacteriota bacterium]